MSYNTDEEDEVWDRLDPAIDKAGERHERNADLLAEYWQDEDWCERNEQYESLHARHEAGDDGCLWQVLLLGGTAFGIAANLWAQLS